MTEFNIMSGEINQLYRGRNSVGREYRTNSVFEQTNPGNFRTHPGFETTCVEITARHQSKKPGRGQQGLALFVLITDNPLRNHLEKREILKDKNAYLIQIYF
jgi:hypothetical protein